MDIGGTTTDIAFVREGKPKRAETGVRIGGWDTFVKGLFVDTFGLGGDSGVAVSEQDTVMLEEERVMPLCMAASAGAVTTIGTKPPAKELVEELKMQVKIESVQ